MKIKVSELFYSIQGEGLWMGVPSIFLRTFGCNFTCQGFGMPRGQLSQQISPIAIHHEKMPYLSYGELPLVSTGCDSYASWHPSFKDLSPMMEIQDITARMMELLPYQSWHGAHLVITGGEPLLGWQRAYPDLLRDPLMEGLRYVTFETNGTQFLTKEFAAFLETSWVDLTFSISPKLGNSGELREAAIRPDVVAQYMEYADNIYLKFVVATEEDLHEALEVTDLYKQEGFQGPVYLMPVGGVESVYALNNKQVAEMALKHKLRYSDRLQVPLFKNAWGT